MIVQRKERDDLIFDFSWLFDSFKILRRLSTSEWIHADNLRESIAKEIYLASYVILLNDFLEKEIIDSTISNYSVFNLHEGKIQLTQKGEKYFQKIEEGMVEFIKNLEL